MPAVLINSTGRWALLVGIDGYSSRRSAISGFAAGRDLNLRGCVRDVHTIRDFLSDNLKIPMGNITMLTESKNSAADPCNQTRASRPTKKNVIQAFEDIKAKAAPGDFFYFHYSGHGDRYTSKHQDKKGNGATDEVICTLDEDLIDVELGEILDGLAEKGLVVCVVLDCCHSGGADRSLDLEAGFASTVGYRQRTTQQGQGCRSLVAVQSYWNHPREYNVIAACQPGELASEIKIKDDSDPDKEIIMGALTYSLLESLKSLSQEALEGSEDPVTYEKLSRSLQSQISKISKQQPLQLGPQSRILFAGTASQEGPYELEASILDIKNKLLWLNKGSSNGVKEKDLFRLYNPSRKSKEAIASHDSSDPEIRVEKVTGLKSMAHLCDEGATFEALGVDESWVARLSGRANAFNINIDGAGLMESISMKHLRDNWQSLVHEAKSIKLHFGSKVSHPDFTVTTHQKEVSIRDKNGKHMPNLPRLANSSAKYTEQLMHLLNHICSYQTVLDLMPSNTHGGPRHEFELRLASMDESADVDFENQPPGKNGPPLATWEVNFKNTDTKKVYVTMLCLGPAYGISQIYPSDCSGEVNEGCSISPFLLDMFPPDMLKLAASKEGFIMRDIIKVIVTTKPIDLKHFQLPNLTENPPGATGEVQTMRDGAPRPIPRKTPTSEWAVSTYEITTQASRSKELSQNGYISTYKLLNVNDVDESFPFYPRDFIFNSIETCRNLVRRLVF